jgi:signal transduction histidine kinase
MSARTQKNKRKYPVDMITQLLLLLVFGIMAFMVSYWVVVLEPQLKSKAEITARALARSQVHILAQALSPQQGKVKTGAAITALDRMLLLNDPHTDNPFILGVVLEVDYDVVKADAGDLDLSRGSTACADCFVTEIPLYSSKNRELLGIAKFYNSGEFYRNFTKDVRSKLLIGAVLILVLLVGVYGLVKILIRKMKAADRELREKQSQLAHAGRLTALGEMATGIAHEINQPLAIIRVAAEGLEAHFNDEDDDSMEAKAAAKIISQVDRSAKIIDDMRSYARADDATFELVNLADPANIALSFFRQQFKMHQIELNVLFNDELPKVKASPQGFEQIVVNLLSNARHAVDAMAQSVGNQYQKKVELRLFHDKAGGEVIIEVKDNGIGMGPEVWERCLEPFYTTKEVGEGTGLGLYIVHDIVRKSNMYMEVESSEDAGTVFRVKAKIGQVES